MDFKTLLSPCPVGVFLDQHFGRAFLHVAGGQGKFSELVPQSPGEPPETLAILVEDVERELEAPVRVKLASPAGAVELHRTERDAMILQVTGQIHCAIHEDSEGAAKEDPAWRGPVNAGGLLYIPRGWWVAMRPSEGPAIQVQLGIENPTGADLLDWITAHVKQHPAFQTDIPRFGDPAARWEYIRELRRALAKMIRDPRLLEWYRRETNLKAQVTSERRATAWHEGAPGLSQITLLTPRKPRIKRATLNTLLLVTMGKRLAFPEDAAPLLHYVCDQAPVTVEQFFRSFEDEFEREELSDFLAVLSKEGVVGLRVPEL